MATNNKDLHVVMLPWSAFGHTIPFFQLATSLAKHGVQVSYISTPRNIDRLPKIPSELASLIQYVTLSLPMVTNLPEGAEATVDLEFDEIQYLKIAYDLLYEPFKQFVTSTSPNWIISDFAAYWMPELAQECRVPLIYFSVYNATTMAFFGPPEYLSGEGQERERKTPNTMTKPPSWGGIFPKSVAFRGYEATQFHGGIYSNNASGVTDGERLARILKGCQAIGIRSCQEFEGDYIDLFQTLNQKPVVPVGALPPAVVKEPGIRNGHGPWTGIFKWLDQQNPGSVIYVGFGSEYKLTKNEVYEIAYGLELAQLPFIWALRKPTWAKDDAEALPPDFATRTLGKGIVSLGWAPQLDILAHPSVGGSLFHLGWGSIIETLQHGHNLILLPFILDQGLNARAIVAKGLGIEVERREDGSYTRNDIADALRRAMLGDEAQEIKTRAKKAAGYFGDRDLNEGHYISNFVAFPFPMATDNKNLHVVMLPWSAFGHTIPFLQLATSLAKHGAQVSYISTPRNIDRLPKIPSELANLIQYVTLSLPRVTNLPERAEATVDLEFDEIQYLKTAYDLLYEPFKHFVSSNSPDWIISDFVSYWMSELAEECRVPLMYFSVYNATTMVFLGPPEYLSGEGRERERKTPDTMTRPPHWGGTIFPPSVACRGYEATQIHSGVFSNNASGVTDGERLARILKGCQAIGIRSCLEFEGEYIDLYQTLTHKPVVPVGVLPPAKVTELGRTYGHGPWAEVFKWLDEQSPASVIYVGFGSEYKLTKNEVYEIAYGLELAQLPFIWALRKPTWAKDDAEALPPDFATRTSGKGIVSLGWAPQLDILAHPSVGGSLFHSGWGSIIETLQHGHNLILLPFIIDQGLNARAIVAKGLGIEVERREDGSYTRNDIANALRRAMLGDEAQEIKTQAKKAAGYFGDRDLNEGH